MGSSEEVESNVSGGVVGLWTESTEEEGRGCAIVSMLTETGNKAVRAAHGTTQSNKIHSRRYGFTRQNLYLLYINPLYSVRKVSAFYLKKVSM